MPPLRRKEVELSVERPLGSPLDPRSELARLTARFEVGPNGEAPTAEELEDALKTLREELERLPGVASGPDRTLEEFLQAYRPRQPEHVDLLREEGEISTTEHQLLRGYFAQHTPSVAEAGPGAMGPAGNRSSPPSQAPRPAGRARSVEAILSEYRIQSLREAGLVRARRQISFDEYMALKRYFATRTGVPGTPDGPP